MPQLVELTSKRLKLARILGLLVFSLGVPALCLSGAMVGHQRPVPIAGQVFVWLSLLMVAGGLLTYAAARFLAWWHHG